MAVKVESDQVSLTFVGLVVHVIVFLSIFDIYFQSPVLRNLPVVLPGGPTSPAKRLVLFVADGLRADKCFGGKTEDGTWAAPFLRSVAKEKGSWGVSHTRVPTESRPGHVALIAGLYEDVSAVTRGWKENPVEFDSVFNRSRFTWSWGSSDILPMFAKGATGERVMTSSYSSQEENFADSNPSRLDSWVFDQFKDFLEVARHNATIRSKLSQDKIVFFLHLLGLDTIGHSSKPWSKEYIEAIQVVDDGVKKVSAILDDFFESDNRTAFIFTADHGMTDWGSHGSSDPEETRTPFLAWGSGIRGPLQATNNSPTPEWNMSDVAQTDVNQADVAPLMSTLLTIGIPVNSVGVLPVELLSGDSRSKAHALLINARQLATQFKEHWRLKEGNSLPLLFRPFKKFSPWILESTFEHILEIIDMNRSDEAISETKEAIEEILEGISYFQTYYRVPLSASVVLGFLGWMVYLGCWLGEGALSSTPTNLLPSAGSSTVRTYRAGHLLSSRYFAALVCSVIILCYVTQDPTTYYLYYLLPLFTWFLVNKRWPIIIAFASLARESLLRTLGYFAVLLVAIELLVLVFFSREYLSVLIVALAAWPMLTPLRNFPTLCLCWMLSLIVLASFPLLPIVGKYTNYHMVYAAGFVTILFASVVLTKLPFGRGIDSKKTKTIVIVQIAILALSTLNVWFVAHRLRNKTDVSLLSHYFSWMTLASTFCIPLLGSTSMLPRLFHIAISLIIPYILLSTSYEAFYFLILQVLLAAWFVAELQLADNGTLLRSLTFETNSSRPSYDSIGTNIRRAYFSLLFLMTSFFGLGNTANINSFSPSSVYCFVTVFSPFVMGLLLICKILIPFLAVAVVLRSIQVSLKRSPSHLFWAILLLSDIMVMNCFFAVRDEGSWLEIGSSIGRFVVVMMTSIAFMLLYALATLLTDVTWVLPKRHSS